MQSEILDRKPVVIAIAGSNGAGKSTFFETFFKPSALRFVNVDEIAKGVGVDAYTAAKLAARIRDELILRKESFVFETVFSDPAGEKVTFLKNAAAQGYTVVLCFIGLNSPELSDERVAIRVMQGGHDVPLEKLVGRFPHTLLNLARALDVLPFVYVYDNSDLTTPFQQIAEYRDGKPHKEFAPLPPWMEEALSHRKWN